MQIRLLGPVGITVGGHERPLSGLRRKAVLAVFGLHAGETVSLDRLIDLIWGENSPATAANTLQSHISHLRSVLGDRRAILPRYPGYRLDLPRTAIDAERAEALIRSTDDRADHAATAERLRGAMALWRGSSLSDVTEVPWLNEQAARLDRLRLDGVQALVEARLALGEHAQVVPELERLAEEHPYQEQLHRLLMLALYRCGRQADALAAYRRLRHTIGEQLGIDPSPALRELETAILRQDAELDPPPPQSVAVASGSASVDVPTEAPVPFTAPAPTAMHVIPAQLPLAAPAFTGRVAELEFLDRVLDTARRWSAADPDACAGAVPIAAVSGTAGVGKTTLAVHWAHRVAAQFPDGQLYADLRGFDAGPAAADPAGVIRGFLHALGISALRTPPEPDAQAGLYRSVLADRRVLIVIDNARDEEQVRPLLPGSSGCLVVITSRNRLGGLVAAQGAYSLGLGLPSTAEARELLARRLDPRQAAAEPDALDEIVVRCARLPLALAVAAAHVSVHASESGLPLTAFAAQLREAATLDPFDGDDAATDVRAVFSWSYQALSPEAAYLFRCLGSYPGPDISASAAASLAGIALPRVWPLLAELTQVNLLSESAPERYSFHDLLRAYAVEQSRLEDGEEQRRAALHRVLDHYLHTANAAALLLDPNRMPMSFAPPQPGVTPTPLADHDAAMAWFAAERLVLFAAVGEQDLDGRWQGWQLAWTMTTFLERRGLWHDNAAVQQVVLEAAQRAGDERGQAHARLILGVTDAKLGRYEEGDRQIRTALTLFERNGDQVAHAHSRANLAWVAELHDDYEGGLKHRREALRLYEAIGHQRGRAIALGGMGWDLSQIGEYEAAMEYNEKALALFSEIDDLPGQASVLDSLGLLYFKLKDRDRGVQCYQQAIALFGKLGDLNSEADSLTRLGDDYAAAGDLPAARRTWQRAVTLLDNLHHPASGALRAKIAAPKSGDAEAGGLES